MIIDRKMINIIDNLIDKYVGLEIKSDFLKEDISSDFDFNEITFLAEKGLILSEANSYRHRMRALNIATIIAKQSINKKLNLVSNIILGRLKNFRSQDLFNFKLNDSLELGLSPLEVLKDILYKANNTVEIAGEQYLLNDFQLDLYNNVKNNKILSVSAPTSAGKSFIIKRIIIDFLLSGMNCCVYLVPTRALITEVINELKSELSNMGLSKSINISSSADLSNIDEKLKNILVLTQERFYQLCNNNEIIVDILIVDEAQNVIDGNRGILLEYSIKYAKRLWKNIKMIFISPLVSNPEVFNKKFLDKSNKSLYVKESTVRQNIIKLYKDSTGYKVVLNNKVLKENVRIKRSKSMYKNICNVICNFNNGENSIIYCNKTSLALNVCNELYNSSEFENLNNRELDEFADFIEYAISKNYMLAKYIRKGIVYHYGNLPSFIRTGIEELASRGLFKIIVCTSTLLQGVNIPAQNIYVYNPSKKDIPLSNLEFWNLIGRAGRMGYDFCGNIILIQNKKWEDINCYNDKNNEVEFISDKYRDVDKLMRIFKEEKISDNVIDDNEIKDYMISATIIDRLNNEKITNEEGNVNSVILENIVDSIIKDFEPPKELLIKLVGIRYDNIKQLWKYFDKNYDNIDDLILNHPLYSDNNQFIKRYKKIVYLINNILMDGNLFDEDSFKKLIFMSYSWMREEKIKKILLYNINKEELEGLDEEKINKKVSSEIKSQVNFLNQDIRFKLVKGIYAYEEILKSYLQYKEREDLIEKISNIPLYLEFGACRNTTIELISYGLNRDFSIEVIDRYRIRENYVKEDLKRMDSNKIKNNYIKKKVKEFISTI